MKRTLFYLIGISLFLASCKGKDPEPPVYPKPDACFTMDKSLIDSGQSVTFTNCTKDGHHYLWIGDDGFSSTEASPTHQFNQRGKNNISLVAYNLDGTKNDTARNVLYIGKRAITSIVVTKVKQTDNNGTPWHSNGTGPDVYVIYGPAATPSKYQTSTQMNFTNATPASFPVDPNIVLTTGNNGPWSFKVVDENGGNNQVMSVFPNIYPNRGDAPIYVANNADYKIEVTFKLVQ